MPSKGRDANPGAPPELRKPDPPTLRVLESLMPPPSAMPPKGGSAQQQQGYDNSSSSRPAPPVVVVEGESVGLSMDELDEEYDEFLAT